MSDSLQPHESQHTRPPCPSPTPGIYSISCPWSRWCHPAISSSVPFSSCPQPRPASGSFPVSQLFAWGGQSIGVSVSASVLPMNTQVWSSLGRGVGQKKVSVFDPDGRNGDALLKYSDKTQHLRTCIWVLIWPFTISSVTSKKFINVVNHWRGEETDR